MTVDETRQTGKIEAFRVGEFEDGDVKRYNPARSFARFDIREGGEHWPKRYYVTLVLAEVDFGGAGEFISSLYDKVKVEVEAALMACWCCLRAHPGGRRLGHRQDHRLDPGGPWRRDLPAQNGARGHRVTRQSLPRWPAPERRQ